MRELTMGKNDAGQRLDRFVGKSLPLLPPALLQKYIRIKRIKVNGAGRAQGSAAAQGDVLHLSSTMSFLTSRGRKICSLPCLSPALTSCMRMRT